MSFPRQSNMSVFIWLNHFAKRLFIFKYVFLIFLKKLQEMSKRFREKGEAALTYLKKLNAVILGEFRSMPISLSDFVERQRGSTCNSVVPVC